VREETSTEDLRESEKAGRSKKMRQKEEEQKEVGKEKNFMADHGQIMPSSEGRERSRNHESRGIIKGRATVDQNFTIKAINGRRGWVRWGSQKLSQLGGLERVKKRKKQLTKSKALTQTRPCGGGRKGLETRTPIQGKWKLP